MWFVASRYRCTVNMSMNTRPVISLKRGCIIARRLHAVSVIIGTVTVSKFSSDDKVIKMTRLSHSYWFFVNLNWGVLYQKQQVSRAGTNNYMPQYLWHVIICSCPWYLDTCPWYLLLKHNIVHILAHKRHGRANGVSVASVLELEKNDHVITAPHCAEWADHEESDTFDHLSAAALATIYFDLLWLSLWVGAVGGSKCRSWVLCSYDPTLYSIVSTFKCALWCLCLDLRHLSSGMHRKQWTLMTQYGGRLPHIVIAIKNLPIEWIHNHGDERCVH